MKILHLSHNGLPDTRVERLAQIGMREGHNICFAGPFVRSMNLPVNSFDRFYKVSFNKFANAKIPSYWRALKRKLSQILSEYCPDFVYAHNIVAAKLISEFPVPFVYDDHEYWSKQSRVDVNARKLYRVFLWQLYCKWEREVLRKASAVITVSETIAEEHKRFCDRVYVAPNFPSYVETESLKLNFIENRCLRSVYVGRPSDIRRSASYIYGTHRNTEGFLKIFHSNNPVLLTVIGDPNLRSLHNIKSLGILPHQKMMKELTQHHVGLVPFKKHWYHKYGNPHKIYEYAHAGLLVLSISDFPCVKQRLGKYYIACDNYNKLKELLQYYADNLDEIHQLRPKIRKFALKNLVWEKKCEPEILRAYSKI